VAKILVADDNSNVQKTVTLALADLGVEVVSVNNGEAAVRKLAEFSPDLILADIFMPVRNGYEVCEYVKKDSRFSRVPVVLLIGAFDPLDEKEAQRVGADGILKKPFVPPDPLITMVKTLLDRTMGERLVAVAASKPATPVFVQARTAANSIVEAHVPATDASEETSNADFRPPVERVAFDEGNHPVAFGTLLETSPHEVAAPSAPALEPVDDELIMTSSRDATLGDPIFWKNDSQEPEPEAETLAETAPAAEPRSWKQEEDSLPRREDALMLLPVEPLELVRDEVEEAPANLVDSGPVLVDPAADSDLHVDPHKAEDLAENPLEWMATAPPIHYEEALAPTPGWNETISNSADTIDRVESLAQDLPEEHAHEAAEVSDPMPPPDLHHGAAAVAEEILAPPADESLAPAIHAPEITEPQATHQQEPEPVPSHSAQSPEDTVHSISVHDWADLAESIPPGVAAEPATPQIKPVFAPAAHVQVSEEKESVPSHSSQSAEDTTHSIPRQDWDDLGASISPSAAEPATPQTKPVFAPAAHVQVPVAPAASFQAALPGPVQPAPPDPALVEAVVQRVLDKMRPQVVDIITKEFLRPIVQALVHREIEKH